MDVIIEILCWFANLARGFFEILGINTQYIDDFTGKLMEMGK